MSEYTNQYLKITSDINPLVAVVMMGIGCMFLLHGWKIFKYMITLDAAVAGFYLGRALGAQAGRPHLDIIFAVGGALAFAALVWPAMKFSVGALGAVVGAAIGYVIWGAFAQTTGLINMANYSWIGSILGALGMIALSMAIFATAALVVASIQGAWLSVTGLIALGMNIQGLDRQISTALAANTLLVPSIILCVAVIGVIIQQSRYLSLMHKKKKAAMAASR